MLLDSINYLCELNLTNYSQLEKELGFGNGTIRKWSVSSPGVDKLLKLANYFGVSVDYILKGVEEDSSAASFQISKLFDSLSREKQELAHKYLKLLTKESEVS